MGRPPKVKPDMPGHSTALLEGLEARVAHLEMVNTIKAATATLDSPDCLPQRVQELQQAIQTLAAYLVVRDQLKASAGDKALVKIAEGML